MAEIAAELVAVERKLWEGTATSVTAQTLEGEIGVLPGHEPFLGQLVDNGVVVIRTADGEKLVAAVQGGFLSVSTEKITVLAEVAKWASEVSTAEVEALADSEDEKDRDLADAEKRALARAQEK
ncbi:F0F1 ATP synthase subunit epsilon [Corynebacterium ulceribovis]|uniref:F0F1 ATP synthase subunit epsilon n=1 Tax=Corynebacterium ulceribovis TaxID=487732 RepID=UPI00036E5C51|nr:F0F1 ATP synthase subunit epsilon [Corynebacterium ulceribovis]